MLKAIDGLRPYMEIRNLIVHYEAHVFADLKEGWLVQFDDWSGEVLGRYSDIEAEAIRKEVQSAVDRLISRLR